MPQYASPIKRETPPPIRTAAAAPEPPPPFPFAPQLHEGVVSPLEVAAMGRDTAVHSSTWAAQGGTLGCDDGHGTATDGGTLGGDDGRGKQCSGEQSLHRTCVMS